MFTIFVLSLIKIEQKKLTTPPTILLNISIFNVKPKTIENED